jgi:hypothetical protein
MNRNAMLISRFPTLQIGGGSDRFQGIDFQRGHGRRFGRRRRFHRMQRGRGWGWLARLFGKIAPSIVSGAKTVGKQLLTSAGDQAINSSVQFLNDVVSGENVKAAAVQRLKEGSAKFGNDAKTQLTDSGMLLAKAAKRKLSEFQNVQQGSGYKRRKTTKKKAIKRKKTSKLSILNTAVKREGSCHFKKCSKLPYRDIFN